MARYVSRMRSAFHIWDYVLANENCGVKKGKFGGQVARENGGKREKHWENRANSERGAIAFPAKRENVLENEAGFYVGETAFCRSTYLHIPVIIPYDASKMLRLSWLAVLPRDWPGGRWVNYVWGNVRSESTQYPNSFADFWRHFRQTENASKWNDYVWILMGRFWSEEKFRVIRRKFVPDCRTVQSFILKGSSV